MLSVIWFIISPALVATAVSLLINNRAEKIRARRDAITKVIDSARDVIQVAVEAAAEYYPLDSNSRTPALEAKLWMAERELRFTLAPIVENADPKFAVRTGELQHFFDNLISELTGGNFLQSEALADVKQVRKVASAGSELRYQLLKLRIEELQSAIDDDFLTRWIVYLGETRR